MAKRASSAQLERVISTDADVRAGVRALRRRCAIMRHVHDTAGDPPLRRQAAGFPGLVRIIVGQQVSVASATAIWQRVQTTVDPMTAEAMAGTSEEALRAAGLSRPKMRTLRAISEAVVAGFDLDALAALPPEDVHARLVAVHGIGPWTADIYLMFCLGRGDAWAPGDLALQIAAQTAMNLKERPDRDELMRIGERWRPWRGVAARLLWAYYAATKKVQSGLPV